MNHEFFIEKALDIAFDMKNGGFNVCAIIVYKNRIMSIGTNSYEKTHTKMKTINSPLKIYLHAEVDALNKFKHILTYNAIRDKKEKIIKSSVMYIACVSRGEKVKKARPCVVCMHNIEAFGIKTIIYTKNFNDNYTIEKW